MKEESNEDRDDQFADGVDVDAAAAGLRSDDELVEVIAPQLRDVQLDALDLWTVPFGMIDSLDLAQILTQLCLRLAKSSFFYFGSTRL